MKKIEWNNKMNWNAGLLAFLMLSMRIGIKSNFVSFIQGFLCGLCIILIVKGFIENRKIRLLK